MAKRAAPNSSAIACPRRREREREQTMRASKRHEHDPRWPCRVVGLTAASRGRRRALLRGRAEWQVAQSRGEPAGPGQAASCLCRAAPPPIPLLPPSPRTHSLSECSTCGVHVLSHTPCHTLPNMLSFPTPAVRSGEDLWMGVARPKPCGPSARIAPCADMHTAAREPTSQWA